MKVVIGEKYYKETEYGAEILRVLTDSNPNMIKCSVNNSLSRIKISPERLAKEYIKITPHATIAFSIAKVGELEDVIIMVHRKEDIEHKKTFPYIVCRQCITDLFANTINPNYNNLITGFCVSEESLPEKVPMETILACDGMIESEMIAVYMNDNLQDILKMVKPKKYDTALYNLFVDHIRYKYKDKQKDYLSRNIVDGYSRTLKGLMQDNEFMYEFNRGFGIYPLTIDVSREELEKNSLSPYNAMVLSNVLLRKIEKTYIVLYSSFIDLDKISGDYALIKDIHGHMYVVAYVWHEEIPIDVASIESEQNIAKLANIPGYATNRNILNALQFSTKKYNN